MAGKSFRAFAVKNRCQRQVNVLHYLGVVEMALY